MRTLVCLALATAFLGLPVVAAGQQDNAPRLVKQDGRYAMMVDGKPFLILGAQINNSSSWASTLPQVWPALDAMHVNTMEAPVYWEQMEPQPGKFDFSGVDLLVNGAREHKLKVVILWFGTWKNGQNHYVPEWIKSDTKTYPREIGPYGKVLDVMSPNSPANLEADKKAFTALMRHVREIDAAQHTVIMIQVENESGSIGAVRDYSLTASRLFAEAVPGMLTKALHENSGTWRQVFGADADERFAAYSTAKYIGEVAAAGKREYDIPMYCNVWITYPVHALENRDHPSAGQQYPSGGPHQGNIDIWKAAAPSIDALAPDIYSDDSTVLREVLAAYARPDNPLFVPETGMGNTVGRYFFYALGRGTIGFSPFGVDFTNWTIRDGKVPNGMEESFALFAPMEEQVARLNFAGKMQTAVEEPGMMRQRLHFPGNGGDVDAVVSFGYPQHDGEVPPGTKGLQGRAMVAQLGPYEFLVTGFDASVSFVVANGAARNEQLEILRADEGTYTGETWTASRIWNGDQTDRGLNFYEHNTSVVKIRLHTIPLLDRQVAR